MGEASRHPEDKVYSLLGIFNVFIPLLYAEGREKAFTRLREEIGQFTKRKSSKHKQEHVDTSHFFAGNPSIRLEITEEAAFHTVGRDHDPFCLPSTRTDLLQDIQGWLSSDSAQHTYWLSGWAGTGKSTTARTITRDYTNL